MRVPDRDGRAASLHASLVVRRRSTGDLHLWCGVGFHGERRSVDTQEGSPWTPFSSEILGSDQRRCLCCAGHVSRRTRKCAQTIHC